MNGIDILIIGLVILSLVRGFRIGLVRQAVSLVLLVIGLIAGSQLAGAISAGTVWTLIIISLSIMITSALGEIGGFWLKQRLHFKTIQYLDSSTGAVLGAVSCLLFVWFGATLAASINAPALQTRIRDSFIITRLDAKLPPVTDVLGYLSQLSAQLNLAPGFGSSEPKLALNGEDVALPDIASFAAVVANSQSSTIKIEGRSCTGLDAGSGFVARQNIVITNAHVVAGMTNPYVSDSRGRYSAQVIGFDAELDIAVLAVRGLRAQALSLSPDRVNAGENSVFLGFPGGGDFTARPSVVLERFTVLGTDLYGERETRRDVYALKGNVQPGNSGGPLLDTNGSVIGVIFARSTTYDQVGYALTSPTVIASLNTALTQPSAGTSQRCIN